jgi:hypothetical protein
MLVDLFYSKILVWRRLVPQKTGTGHAQLRYDPTGRAFGAAGIFTKDDNLFVFSVSYKAQKGRPSDAQAGTVGRTAKSC